MSANTRILSTAQFNSSTFRPTEVKQDARYHAVTLALLSLLGKNVIMVD